MSSPRIHAPDLTPAGDWFNVPAPLTLAALRGKVVLLDFWTYGCINCMHILPGLRRLEEKYRDELVVIGVHSAKFANERKSENIRRILVRYDIDHPVVSDADFTIWRAYGARAWPTLVLIDPEGYVVATASGEGHLEQLDRAIAAVIQVFDERQLLDRRPIAQSPERERLKTSALAFPGKVLADETGSRLFIADSNHHRVLVASMTGTILDVAGSGAAGWVDGGFDNATFYRPQGLALEGDMLYVADTENHVVRSLDLKARRVTTVAGTGRMGAWPDYALRASSRSRLNDLSARPNGRSMRETPLNSPWDLVVREQLLFVAMAGTHQIWLRPLAGGSADRPSDCCWRGPGPAATKPRVRCRESGQARPNATGGSRLARDSRRGGRRVVIGEPWGRGAASARVRAADGAVQRPVRRRTGRQGSPLDDECILSS